jgi:phage terminase large subunit-like protein
MSPQTRLEFENPGNIFGIKPWSSRKTNSKKSDHYGGLKWGAASLKHYFGNFEKKSVQNVPSYRLVGHTIKSVFVSPKYLSTSSRN